MILYNFENINIRTAYKAMYSLIEDYYYQTKLDDIGGLAGDMALAHSSNKTIDPAMWEKWVKFLDLNGKQECTKEEAFIAMKLLLNDYASSINSEQIRTFIAQLKWSMWTKILNKLQNSNIDP